jgi:hypothetical protein
VSFLIEKGADINIYSEEGMNALDYGKYSFLKDQF